ncbi:MAG: hypothetical protein U9R06_00490 [Patescibacteria group bacterium]|nr:hypothetical protein [Patescibacteria group bacterium]
MLHCNNEKKQLFSLKLVKKLIFSLVIVIVFDFFFFPFPVLAAEPIEPDAENNTINASQAIENDPGLVINNLPENEEKLVKKINYYTLTAYTSEVAQCDSTPCVTANGFNLCEHGIEDSVAANFLPFGAKIKIPELFGDRVFVVRDRMNSRYTDRIDIWMLDKADARKFGIRVAKVEILEP